MRRNERLLLVVAVLVGAARLANAQSRVPESLTNWPRYVEVNLPEGEPELCDFLASPAVYTHAGRSDLSSLRLYDATGREVPFAFRHREPRHEYRTLPAKTFNRVALPDDGSSEVTLELDNGGQEHNRIEITTSGVNFRRAVRLDGSDDGKNWRTLVETGHIMYFSVPGQVFNARSLSYAPSRFRFLRVRVSPDPSIANDRPADLQVAVRLEVTDPGLFTTWPAALLSREPSRSREGYSSEWTIAMPGNEQVPWEVLEFEVKESDFVRAYRLEEVLVSGQTRVLASGQWERRRGQSARLPIHLGKPFVSSQVRLVVIDQRNPPLTLSLVAARSTADQFVFKRTAEMTGPLRLYLGNAAASAPGYDLDRTLPEAPSAPQRATLGNARDNPDYRAVVTPVPFLDRNKWVTPVAFGSAAVLLAGLLLLMGREAIRRHDTAATPAPAP